MGAKKRYKVVILEDNIEQMRSNYFSALYELKEYFDYYWLLDIDRKPGTEPIRISRYLVSGILENKYSDIYGEIRDLFKNGKNIIVFDNGLKKQLYPDDEFGLELTADTKSDLERLRLNIINILEIIDIDILIIDRHIDRLGYLILLRQINIDF